MSIEIALMIEGQDGLNWERWQRIARVAEDSGYVGLYRSDHFTNPSGPYKDSLECWVSLAWLADHTSRIEFGPLVSPVSFRHPSMLVRMAAAVSDLSGGRLQFGIGAGWQEREHTHYSYSLGDVPTRMARFREATHIMAHLLRSEEPLTYEGKHYQVREAVLLPRPKQHVPIVIGGSGRNVTLPVVARYADEWNSMPRPAEDMQEINAYLDGLLDRAGRPRSAVRRSVMAFITGGKVARTDQPVEQLVGDMERGGIDRVMLNWRDDYDDVEGMAHMGRTLIK